MNNYEGKVHFQLDNSSACRKTHPTLKFTTFSDEVTCKLCRRWLAVRGFYEYIKPIPWYKRLYKRIIKFIIG